MCRFFVFISIIFLITFQSQGQEVQWMSFEEAIEAQKKEQRKIFVDLYTDWCGWCKRMDKTTMTDPFIVEYLNSRFYPVKFNAEQKGDIKFKGETFKLRERKGKRNYHELAAHISRNQLSYPTFIFLNEEAEVIQPVKGYQDASTFKTIMTYIGDDHFKKTPWSQYKQTYTIPD
jgi:thioredoxin-related protein